MIDFTIPLPIPLLPAMPPPSPFDALGSATRSLVDGLLALLGRWLLDGASWLLGHASSALGDSVAPQLASSWFLAHLRSVETLGEAVAAPLFLIAVLHVICLGDLAGMVRLVLLRLPLSALGAVACVQLVSLTLAATDAASALVAGGRFGAGSVLGELSHRLASDGGAWPSAVAVLIGILTIAAALLLWLELVVRSAAITAGTLFLPLALAATIWPASAGVARRLGETIAALVLSKLVVVGVLAVGISAVAAGSGGLGGVIGGIALVLLATLCPFVILRLIPLVDSPALASLEGIGRRAARRAWAIVEGVRLLGQRDDIDATYDYINSLPGPEGSWAGGAPMHPGNVSDEELDQYLRDLYGDYRQQD